MVRPLFIFHRWHGDQWQKQKNKPSSPGVVLVLDLDEWPYHILLSFIYLIENTPHPLLTPIMTTRTHSKGHCPLVPSNEFISIDWRRIKRTQCPRKIQFQDSTTVQLNSVRDTPNPLYARAHIRAKGRWCDVLKFIWYSDHSTAAGKSSQAWGFHCLFIKWIHKANANDRPFLSHPFTTTHSSFSRPRPQ